MRGRDFFVLVLFGLAACAAPAPRPVQLPNGHSGYSLSCNGTARNIADCMNLAAKFCGGPYTVVDRDSAATAGIVTPAGNSAVVMHGVHRVLIFECGQP